MNQYDYEDLLMPEIVSNEIESDDDDENLVEVEVKDEEEEEEEEPVKSTRNEDIFNEVPVITTLRRKNKTTTKNETNKRNRFNY